MHHNQMPLININAEQVLTTLTSLPHLIGQGILGTRQLPELGSACSAICKYDDKSHIAHYAK